MRKKIASLSLLLAWLCANGAVLDAVQLVAWGKMFAGYSQVMPIGAALRATLDPSRPCDLCVAVVDMKANWGKQQLPNSGSEQNSMAKVVLALETPPQFVLPPTSESWPTVLASAAPSRTERVPVPPPRV